MWQMEVAERQPFLVSSAAQNASKMANCNSFKAIKGCRVNFSSLSFPGLGSGVLTLTQHNMAQWHSDTPLIQFSPWISTHKLSSLFLSPKIARGYHTLSLTIDVSISTSRHAPSASFLSCGSWQEKPYKKKNRTSRHCRGISIGGLKRVTEHVVSYHL